MENLCNLEWEKLVGPCQLSILITLQKPRTSQFLSVKWWESWLTSSFIGCVKCEFSWKKGRRAFNPPMPSTVRISDALSSLTWRGPWTLPLLSWCFLVQEPPGLPKPVLPNPRLTLLVEFSQTHWPVELKLWLNISRPSMSSWEGGKRRGKMLSLEPGSFLTSYITHWGQDLSLSYIHWEGSAVTHVVSRLYINPWFICMADCWALCSNCKLWPLPLIGAQSACS